MSDMADAVRENDLSVVKVAVAEQKRRERGDYYRQSNQGSKKKIIFSVGGIVLVLIALGVYYFLNQKIEEKNKPAQIIETPETPISYDNASTIDMTGASNKSDVSNLIDPEMKVRGNSGSIKTIFLNKNNNGILETFSLKDLLFALKVTAPGSLIRSFSNKYMLGTYTPASAYDTPHLFLIINVNDYNMAYAGMLQWEKTMLDDFFTLFHVDVSGKNSELFGKPFKDIIIKNKDARILYTKDGVDALFYLFTDKNTLVITDNQEGLKEIITRLLVQQTKPL